MKTKSEKLLGHQRALEMILGYYQKRGFPQDEPQRSIEVEREFVLNSSHNWAIRTIRGNHE